MSNDSTRVHNLETRMSIMEELTQDMSNQLDRLQLDFASVVDHLQDEIADLKEALHGE